jgi:transposase
MAETLTILSERVDDIPLLVAQLERMGVPTLLDEHFPTHGNWVGLSLGWVSVVWLTHILSQANHRLNHVEPWAEKRLHILRGCTGQRVHPLDVSDDRLAAVLEALSEDIRWRAFEGALTQRLLRVYDLEPEHVRLDSTTASGYWRVTEEGLFQFGHSKDHRPDLPRVKVMLSALDPLGLPVATDIVSGQRADDPLYIPAVTRVWESLGRRGLLYIGDCKMGALETRAFLQAGGDYYLCPLSELQLPTEALEVYMAPVWAQAQAVTPILRPLPNGKQEVMGEGYERLEPLTAMVAEETITWMERRLVIRSHHLAQTGERALHSRLAKAQAALAALQERRQGKKRFVQLDALREAADAILQRYQVQGLLSVCYTLEVCKRPVRRYGKRPASVRVEQEVCMSAAIDQEAVQEAVRRLGWRVYATNAPVEHLSLTQAVRAYRSEYLIERGFGRLKGQPLSLTPMYVEWDDHATGLIRLLAVGLRVLTLLEFVVRRHLAATGAQLTGLYAGNPKRATAQPTAERLLEAFQELTLTIIREGRHGWCHLTPLSPLHQRILALLDLPVDIYTRLCLSSQKPP